MENYYLYFPKLRKASNAFRRKIKDWDCIDYKKVFGFHLMIAFQN